MKTRHDNGIAIGSTGVHGRIFCDKEPFAVRATCGCADKDSNDPDSNGYR